MGAAKSILERMIAKSAETAEEVALKAASKARDFSPDGTNAMWEALQARRNLKMADEAKKTNEAIRAKVISSETVPRSTAEAPTAKQLEDAAEVRASDEAHKLYDSQFEAEKASRAYDPKAVQAADEATKVVDDSAKPVSDPSKLVAGAAAMPAMSAGFTNPADIVKSGYDKFNQVRQSVVNKIVDLTDMTATNPHVPQYAKDTYNKAADAVVSGATDPLNFVGGAGAADALAAAGGAAYDMYSGAGSSNAQRKPSSTPVNNNPAQVVNWRPK